MRLEELVASPMESWVRAERQVNDGSPSGYDKIHTVSMPYRAFGGSDQVVVPTFDFERDVSWLRGSDQQVLVPPGLGGGIMPVHPDMLSNERLSGRLAQAGRVGGLTCAPTSSQRTLFVQAAGERPWFVKLHYDGLLGRFSRILDHRRITAALAVNADLERSHCRFPPNFSFLPERIGCWAPLHVGDARGFGAIVRECAPYCMSPHTVILPFFSLFSRDRLEAGDPPLLAQLLDTHDPLGDILENLIRPMLRAYFFLGADLGLLPEWNAQNLLVALTDKGQICGTVMRDLQGTYRDLAYRPMTLRGVNDGDYKVLTVGALADERAAQRQRSFLYDFKFSEYVLAPVAQCLHDSFGTCLERTNSAMRATAKTLLRASHLEENYFPPGAEWYRQRPGVASKGEMFLRVQGRPKYR